MSSLSSFLVFVVQMSSRIIFYDIEMTLVRMHLFCAVLAGSRTEPLS